MKKTFAFFLAVVLSFSLAACSGDGTGDANAPSAGKDSAAGGAGELQGIKVGDTITNDNFEFTLTRVEFANELYTFLDHDNTKYDDHFMLPLSDSETNPGGLEVKARGDTIMLTFTFRYKFIGKSAFSDTFRRLGAPCVYYGDGYTFDGNSASASSEYAIFVETDDSNRAGWYILSHSTWLDVQGATHLLAIDRDYNPLDDTTYTCRGYITLPLETYENTDEPLAIYFASFTEYPERFTIR